MAAAGLGDLVLMAEHVPGAAMDALQLALVHGGFAIERRRKRWIGFDRKILLYLVACISR